MRYGDTPRCPLPGFKHRVLRVISDRFPGFGGHGLWDIRTQLSLQKGAPGRNTIAIILRKTRTYRALCPQCGFIPLNMNYVCNPILKTTSSSLHSTVETLCRTLRLRRSANQRSALMRRRPMETRSVLANQMIETAFGSQSRSIVFLIAV